MDSIGRYRVQRELGRGAFATVLLAQDERRRPVAIKVLSPEVRGDAMLRERLLAEATLLRWLDADSNPASNTVPDVAPASRRPGGPAVVRVHEVGELDDGRPWFAMDYCDAGSLADLRHRPNDPGTVLRLCADAGRALAQLHDHRVVHRDVTPGNLLLRTSPTGVRVVLSDLGVARHLDDPPEALTVGTPAYMAREQALGIGLDPRSDIHSLAAVTYTLLVGHTPFAVRSVEELLARNPAVPAASIAERIGAPALLDDLLQAALTSDPNRRPPNARVFAAALDRIAEAMGAAPVVALADLSGPTPTPLTGAMPWQASAPQLTASMDAGRVPSSDAPTPTAMLRSYLGDDSYQVQRARERHTRLFRIWAVTLVGALAVLVLLILAWPRH